MTSERNPPLMDGLRTAPTSFHVAADDPSLRLAGYFSAHFANLNTRDAYCRAVTRFLRWSLAQGLDLVAVGPATIATYIDGHAGSDSIRKQHLVAIREFFDWLVIWQIVTLNPARLAIFPKVTVSKSHALMLSANEVRRLLDHIELRIGPKPESGEMDVRPPSVIGLRDRAMLGVIVYSYASIASVIGMTSEDYYQKGRGWWLRLREGDGKSLEVPACHIVRIYLDAYIKAGGMDCNSKSPLFRSSAGSTGRLTANRLSYRNTLDMVRRRGVSAGFPEWIGCLSLRGNGLSAGRKGGSTIDQAKRLAADWSSRLLRCDDGPS